MDKAPAPYATGRDNQVGRRTSLPKLNGRVYTPAALAKHVVAGLPMSPGSRWLDPSCGDGAFLAAVLERAIESGVSGLSVEGWDIDGEALDSAAARLGPLAAAAGATLELTHRDALEPTPRRFDCVVGNPPYLEAKRMADGLKARLRAEGWVSATGAFDLYAIFVELAARLTVAGGRFSLIVPNRLLVTGATARLRELLLSRGTVSLEDRSGSDDFGAAAAVYPVVLTWHEGGARSLRASGEADGLEAAWVSDRLGGRWGVVWQGPGGHLLRRVLHAPGLARLSERFEIRWTVSFHRAGLREQFVSEDRPDSPHARRFLGGGRFAGNRELDEGQIRWAGGWIDYDEARARECGNAFPLVALFDEPKVVVAQNARRCRAALDRSGLVLKDTFLLVRARGDVPDAERWLAWLVLVLQSDVFHVLYAQLFAGTRKGGGYLHFLGSYLAIMPIPAPPDGPLETRDARTAEQLVRQAYGVTDDEGAWLDASAGVAWALPC